MDGYQYVGVVTQYFNKISVAAILLEDALYVDDWILFYGPRTEFEQQVLSMQLNHEVIDHGELGEEIAIKVVEPVHEGDEVFLLLDKAEDDRF
ncbi:MAG: translation elongation factor-like protein [Anaerolineae bacterium]|nr:translation elongation factor-like protein [Anaerolineae bacterium]